MVANILCQFTVSHILFIVVPTLPPLASSACPPTQPYTYTHAAHPNWQAACLSLSVAAATTAAQLHSLYYLCPPPPHRAAPCWLRERAQLGRGSDGGWLGATRSARPSAAVGCEIRCEAHGLRARGTSA